MRRNNAIEQSRNPSKAQFEANEKEEARLTSICNLWGIFAVCVRKWTPVLAVFLDVKRQELELGRLKRWKINRKV